MWRKKCREALDSLPVFDARAVQGPSCLEQIRWTLSEHAWEFDGLLRWRLWWCGQVHWTPYCCSGSDAKTPQDSRRQEEEEQEEEKKKKQQQLREDPGCSGEAP